MSEIRVDTIAEKTSANGVAIDSVTLKDGGATLTDNITFSASGKGVHLGVTSATAANLLNDYEEGSFDVLVADATSGGNTNAMTASGEVDGVYTKIGDMVYWSIAGTTNTTGLTGTNSFVLRGLPFAANNRNNFYEGMTPRFAAGNYFTLDSGHTQAHSTVANAATWVQFYQSGSNSAVTAILVNDVADDAGIRVQGMYHTAS